MEPVIKKEKTSAESRRRASTSSDVTKKKSSRACAPCRKRKVKCNGEQPCERCFKTDTECIFDKQHQKKETPKSIAENHEPRLKELEAFSVQFSRILDKSKVEPPFFYNPNQIQHPAQRGLTISTTGQGMYVPDTYLRTDRVPSIYKVGKNSEWNPIIQELLPRPEEVFYANKSKLLDIRHNLLDIYFRFIDPLIPILHKPSFLQSIQQQQPQSDLLLNAIYAVSSRWDTTVPSTGDQPRGWLYYQNAVKLIDLYSTPPRLSTVQAVFLLLKYNEHVRRPGFMWRTRFYFQIIVRMCKDLGLTHDIPSTKPILSIEIERRKRTFWAVFCYDVMMSIENGTAPNFEGVQLTLETPNVLADEVPVDSENVMHFILFTKVMRVQADTLRFLRGKFSRLETTTVNMNDGEAEENNGDEKKEYEEEEEEEDENEKETSEASSLTIGKLAENLYSIMNLIISTCARPQKENFSYSICFLHLASHFSSILLHRPFMSAHNSNSTHTLHCIESAGKIKSIVQLVLECDGIENIYCSIRGIQQMVHYLSAAVTVYKSIPDKSKELADTLYLARHLASISPATEVMSDSSLISPSSLYGVSTQGSNNSNNNDDKMMVVDTNIKQEGGQKQQHQQQQMQCQHQQMQYQQQQQQQQQQNNHYNNNNNVNNNVNNNRSSEQSLKRKSLHLPDQPSSHQDHRALRVMRNRLSMPIMQDPSSSLLLSNYSQQQQQQQQQQLQLQYAFQQQQPYDEPSTFLDQYDTEMRTIHPDHQQQQQQQPQSLLGLLFNDDESTMKDIPTL